MQDDEIKQRPINRTIQMWPVDFWQGHKGVGWQQVVLGALTKHGLVNKPQSSFMPYVKMTSVNHAFKYKEEDRMSRGFLCAKELWDLDT